MNRLKSITKLLLSGSLLFFGTTVANAATFTVDRIDDATVSSCTPAANDCTLRGAVVAASSVATNDIIDFEMMVFASAQTITLLNGDLSIQNAGSLTIIGTGARLLTISGNNLSLVVFVSDDTPVMISGVTITGGNFSGGDGGGIQNRGTLTVTDSTISGNKARFGGGIANISGTLSVIRSTVSGNSVSGNNADGGGLANFFGTMTVTNSTISGNSATEEGGGIMNIGTTLTIDSSTICNNTAISGGGIFNFSGASGIVNGRNSIIADNIANSSRDFGGTLTSQGYNLIESTGGLIVIGTMTGDILGPDPQLLPLGNYGGPTNSTALRPNSPAIDSGNRISFQITDQRGAFRPQDGDLNGLAVPDIGAYERQVAILTVTKIADTNDGTCDSDCSLREAIAAANAPVTPDEAIRFDETIFGSIQSITLTGGQLSIDGVGTVLINGTGANLLSINGNNLSRVLFINTSSNVTITGVKFVGGNSGGSQGGGILSRGSLTLNNSIVDGNTSTGNGGGIYGDGINSILTINNSTVSHNFANGAGLYNFNGTLTINDSFIIDNSGINGVGILNVSGPLTLNGSVVANNVAANGGGIGGGILNSGGLVTATNSTITNNSAAGSAGGGGIYNTAGGVINLTNSSLSGNSATNGDGGGVNNFGATLNFTNVTINNNSSGDDRGGGIASFGDNSVVTLTSVTVSNNLAAAAGGIFNQSGSILNLTNSTIASNTATAGGGGGINNFGGTVNVRNSIIADNTAQIGPDIFGTLTSEGYNLVENTTDTTITGTTTGNILGQDPQLIPLVSNGGATQTQALRPASPAVDKGKSFGVVTDQRGSLRPFDNPNIPNANGGDGSDIGAFERQPTDFVSGAQYDFDGDGKSDVSVFRPSTSSWYLLQSQAGFTGVHFGSTGDLITPADFDGDGKTDVAVFRPSTGTWYRLHSSNGQFVAVQFGQNGDIPVPVDYDGDGKADINVFRPSTGTWYRLNSSNGQFVAVQFGQNGDAPIVANFDGDTKADITVFRPSNGVFYWLNSSDGQFNGVQFGSSTDIPTVADFDGDGKTDISFFHPSTGTWEWISSSNGQLVSVPFGQNGDVPAPADYDGDGKSDLAVFRNGDWYLLQSLQGFRGVQFGATNDRPVPSAYQQ